MYFGNDLRKIFVFSTLLLLISETPANNSRSTYYLNPGFRISWDFKSNIFIGIKISFGKMINEKYYYNITLGKKFIIDDTLSNINNKHIYVDLQSGSFFGSYPNSAGLGLGVAIFSKGTIKHYYPRLSVFTGSGLFLVMDYIYKKNLLDLGLQTILPIPFNEEYRNLKQ